MSSQPSAPAAGPMDLGQMRTMMAADRTLMAWTRTSMAMLSFAFTIYKVLQGLEHDVKPLHPHAPQDAGMFLAGMSVLCQVMGAVQYWANMRELRRHGPVRTLRAPAVMGFILAALGIAIFIAIALRRILITAVRLPVGYETGLAAAALAAVFLVGGGSGRLKRLIGDRDALLSLFGGMSSAYVFVHMMPELERARGDYVTFGRVRLFDEGIGVYFVALLGFMVFYSLNHLRGRRKERAGEASERIDFRLHIAEFAAYVWMISYLLVNNPHQSAENIVLYTVAMAAHFLGIDHSLLDEHGRLYDRLGRYVLAATVAAGWASGELLPIPRDVIALLIAFLSGAIIMNALLMELPSSRVERFAWFVSGGVIYGLLLVRL